MGEIILVSGENGSGKSRFAEQLAAKFSGEHCYIATMIAKTPENERRIRRHRRQREGLGFITLEIPYRIEEAAVPIGALALLEDVSNLLANTIFERRGDENEVYRGICTLADRCSLLIAVTISGLCPDGYTGETAAYIRSLNRLNRLLFNQAAAAVKMKENAPSWQKGEDYALDAISLGGPVHL